MSEVTIEGKVIKVRGDKDGYYLCIEIDKNGIEKNTNTDKYYKPLLAEVKNDKGEFVSVSGCAQGVKKDEDYYYVEICVPPWLISKLSIPSVIEKNMKIKFECESASETQIKKDKIVEIVECEIYE